MSAATNTARAALAVMAAVTPAVARPFNVRVELPDGKPAAGAEVVAYPVPEEVRDVLRACLGEAACAEKALVARGSQALREAPAPSLKLATGPDGAAGGELPAGEHSLLVRAGALGSLERVDGENPVAMRIALAKPRRFVLYAASRGAALAGAEVYAYSDRFLLLSRAKTDAAGRAEVAGPYLYSAMVENASGRGFVQSWEQPVTLPRPRLCGVVLDGGAPAAGAVVRRGPGIPPLNADADGKFCVDVLGEDEVLWAQHGPRATLTTQALSPARVQEATLHLEEGQRIEGALTGDDGKPVAGARVHVERAHDDEDAGALLEVPAGEDGRFAAEGLPRVALRLRARAPGYTEAAAGWTGQPAALRMRRLHPLAVTVTRKGRGLDQAWTEARALPGTEAFSASGNAGADGRFFFSLPAGRYAVVGGNAAGSTRVSVPEASAVTVETRLRLVEVAAVRGGLPVAEAKVETVPEEDEDPTGVGDTAEWGRAHIWTGPAPVAFTVARGGIARAEFASEAEGGALAVAELPPLRKVKVTVTRDGKPAAGADVYVVEGTAAEGAQPRFIGVTNAQGVFAAELVASDVTVRALRPLDGLRGEASAPEGAAEAAVALALQGSEVLALDDEGKPVAEVWLPGRGAVPTREGRVQAWVEGPEDGDDGSPVAQVWAPGHEGETRIEDGKVQVKFSACGYLLGSTETEEGRLVTAPVAFASGEGMDEAGFARGGAEAEGPEHSAGTTASGESSAEGTFRIGCVPPGDAVVRSPGFAAEAHVRVPAGAVGGPVRLRLHGARFLRVRTAAGATVSVYRVDGEELAARVEAGDDGAVEVGPLRDGEHDVRAEAEHATQLKRLTIGAEGPAELDLPDPPHAGKLVVLPVEGYEVTNAVLETLGDRRGVEPLRVGLTGEDGVTEVRGVPPGPWWLELRARGPEGEASLSTGVHLGAAPVRLRLRAASANQLELVPAEGE